MLLLSQICGFMKKLSIWCILRAPARITHIYTYFKSIWESLHSLIWEPDLSLIPPCISSGCTSERKKKTFDKFLLPMTVEIFLYLFNFLLISFWFNNFMLKELNIHEKSVSREWCNAFQWDKIFGIDYEWGCGRWTSPERL